MKHNKHKKYNSGFTLVEMMIYVAIFAIIMSGAIVSIYGIIGASSRNATKAMVQEEGSFLLDKIDWVLSTTHLATVSPDGLTLTSANFDGTTTTVVVSGDGNMSIDTGSGAKGLNNSNITVTCNPPITPPSTPSCTPTTAIGCFLYCTGSSDGINPTNVSADFTVSTKTSEGRSYSQEFSTVKYLRK